ncbi:MAG: F-box protein [Parachlamydiaceae bacterium]
MTIQNLDIVANLPYELKLNIFDQLSFKDLITCKVACKHWQQAIDNYPRYRRLSEKKFKIYWQKQVNHRNGGIVCGCISALVGATLSGALLPAILIGSGEAGLVYAYTSRVEDYSIMDNVKQIGFGALSGLTTGLATFVSPITAIFGKTALTQIGNQTIAQLAGTLAQKILNGKKVINSSLANSSINSLASSATAYGLDKIILVTDNFSDIILRQLLVGVGSSGAGTAAQNLAKKKKWSNKIEEAGLFGGILGAIQGVGDYYQ